MSHLTNDYRETHGLKETKLGRYTFGNCFGANWKSYEHGVAIGTVRIIDGVEHYAWTIYKRWLKTPEVCWARVDGKYGLGEEGKP